MSVQFGRWNFEGQPPAHDYIEKVRATIAPYGPDSDEQYSEGGIKVLYRAFCTTKESRRETQPYISPSGVVITWDGRLDNRADLVSELRDSLTINSTDIAIVAVAYEKWGVGCLAKLVGDWALSIWNPVSRLLILAKDPIGTRHLFYSFDNNKVTWCTILDPLVRFAETTFTLNEEYIAGWFSYFPAAHLTPYVGIHAVPPSSSVLLRPGKHTVSKYWDFDPARRIRYRTDEAYEEHFRTVFAQAVQRRLRSDCPVLAELSGGLDSSSIVCMADRIVSRGAREVSKVETISWYDDSYDHIEPDTNELHWITKVEEKRGHTGYHINLRELKAAKGDSSRPFTSDRDHERFAATPSNEELSIHLKHYAAYMLSHSYRVTLSGIGGDEATCGDAPSPTIELQNLLAEARFVALVSQLRIWATKMKQPALSLLCRAVWGFVSLTLTGVSVRMGPAPWFHPDFVRRNYAAACGYPSRVKLFGPLPSFQANVAMLNVLRRLVADWALRPDMLREVRFPYLDRDFLEFIYAIPREQIVGVGKRRFLMKRALAGIVPDKLLNRRRKLFVEQATRSVATEWTALAEDQHIFASSGGFVKPDRLREVLQNVRRAEAIPSLSLMRSMTLEFWLRHLTRHGILKTSMAKHEDKATGSPLRQKKSDHLFNPQFQLADEHNTTEERR